jgi:hypothetical protein
MEKLPPPADFKDFLQLLNSAKVEYFSAATAKPEMFSTPDQIVRLGIPPICIDVITSASGVQFAECYARRNVRLIDSIEVNIIHPDDLKQNKKASGRAKDLNDLENLP